MKKPFLSVALFCALFIACRFNNDHQELPPFPEQSLAHKVDSLKQVAKAGDLIVRLGDDFLSYYIKQMNEKDQSFSHAGIIVEKEGQKLVAHITPDSATNDCIIYTPLDSFINPAKTLQCALFRYNIPQNEKDKALALIEAYRQKGTQFDRLYDLTTDDEMYCSEMISKVFSRATQNQLQFKTITIPSNLRPLLLRYFKGQLSSKIIASRQVMTIDNLYLVPQCAEMLALTLKTLPGQ